MFAFDWLADPTAWVGLLTLVVLEIVLGIDNLVFVAILADKLPPGQRDRARISGLAIALLMRLLLLGAMSWLVKLTDADPQLAGVLAVLARHHPAARWRVPAVQGHAGAARAA